MTSQLPPSNLRYMADSSSFDWRKASPSELSEVVDREPKVETPQPQQINTGAQGPVYVRDIRPQDEEQPPLPCLEGPCKFFTEIGQVQGVVEGHEHLRRYQYCERLMEETTTMTLQELTIRYCSRYAPPLWKWSGWRQKLRSAPYQMRAARKAYFAPKISIRILATIRKLLDVLRLSEKLKLKPTPQELSD